MKAVVLLNEGAGTLAGLDVGESQRRIARAFAAAGADADVRFVEPRYLRPIAQEAARGSDFDVIFAGGGDGTLNTIANVVADSPKIFGVLPLGTHNHFAKDLKIPLDLDEAIVALVNGEVAELPVAEVNGHVFLNFSAIGLHPEVIKDREAQREEKGRGKWPAMAVAMARKIIKKPNVHRLTLSARGHTIARRTPSVIVCNNPHQMEVFGVADASVPERGLLNVYVATRGKRRTLIWLMLRAAARRIDEDTKHFEALALPELRIDSNRRVLPVSVDGEVTELPTPLIYRIRGKPLRVLTPAPPPPPAPPAPPLERSGNP
jgi:diacylglycerol kinase family enzyme